MCVGGTSSTSGERFFRRFGLGLGFGIDDGCHIDDDDDDEGGREEDDVGERDLCSDDAGPNGIGGTPLASRVSD